MRILIYIFILMASLHAAAADISNLTRGLFDLRNEIESAAKEADSLQKEKQAELDLWTQKRLELESALQRETLRQMQLAEKTARLALRVKKESKSDPKAKSEILKWTAQGRAWVNSSLPFRREHRLQVLGTIEERVERGMESLESLAAELWMFYEDELKMAGDNEFRLADMPSEDGRTVKNEVVRLGLFTMFTRDAKGEVKQAVQRPNEGWRFEKIADSSLADIERLFANMKAKKESGLYKFPLQEVKDVL